MKRSIRQMITVAALLLMGTALPIAGIACDAAGSHTHVGQVLSVDGNRFTIRDAQSGGPISFTAAKEMQGAMPVAGQNVSVKYSDAKKGLVAKAVH